MPNDGPGPRPDVDGPTRRKHLLSMIIGFRHEQLPTRATLLSHGSKPRPSRPRISEFVGTYQRWYVPRTHACRSVIVVPAAPPFMPPWLAVLKFGPAFPAGVWELSLTVTLRVCRTNPPRASGKPDIPSRRRGLFGRLQEGLLSLLAVPGPSLSSTWGAGGERSLTHQGTPSEV